MGAICSHSSSSSWSKTGRVSAGRELSRIVANTACTNLFPQLDGHFLLFRKCFESPLLHKRNPRPVGPGRFARARSVSVAVMVTVLSFVGLLVDYCRLGGIDLQPSTAHLDRCTTVIHVFACLNDDPGEHRSCQCN